MNDDNLDAIADIFDCDPAELSAETPLETLGWDSMAMLSVIAMAKVRGRTVDGATIRAMKTVADILAVL